MKGKYILFLICSLFLCEVSAQTLEQARTLFTKGEYEQAKPVFKKYAKSQPSNGNYNYWYGVCCLKTGEAEEAVKPLEIAVKKRITGGQLYLGQAYNETYRFEDAVNCFEEYIADLSKRKKSTEEAEKLLEKSKSDLRMLKGVEDVCIIDSFVVDKATFLNAYKISEESGKLFTFNEFFKTEGDHPGTVYETEIGNKIYYSEKGEKGNLDIFSKMTDNAGALRSDYNEYDGMHISAPTYDIILSYTQRYIQETPEPEASSKHAPVSSPAATTTSAPEENSTPDESSAPADSEPDSTSSMSEDYDKAFFADDLFIGDSISTGFSLYGVLDPKNVAAAVGYTPYKALNNAIDLGNGVTDTAYNYAVTMQPKHIFIMLGSNGITAAASMEESYRTLVEKLQANCPDSTVYILSVTPVTTDSSSAANAGIDNSMIRDFNKYLRDLASEKGVTYIDLYALLSDDNGYFLHEYAENDGLHFKGATYKVVLKYIEDII